MTEVEQTSGAGHGSAIGEAITGKEKLERLKARFFSPETQAQRVARALEALRTAVKPSNLDPATLKHVAQSTDLEGV